MFSIRNHRRKLPALFHVALSMAASASFMILGGCQRARPPQPDALNDAPLIVDEAMQIRDWDRSVAYYPSGAVVAGSPRVTFVPRYETRLAYAADPLIGLGNILLIPFTLFATPPGAKVASRGAIVPPTHTAVPEVRVIE